MGDSVYCKAPWTSITYMPGGKYAPCCAWGGKYFDTPEQVVSTIGDAFLRGEIPIECSSACPPAGDAWRNAFNLYITDFKTPMIQMLDFRNNNLCNLKCRSCGPTFSTSWAAELKQDTISAYTPARLPDIDLSHCKQIYFAGGEPLLNPQHYELLELLIEQGINPRLMYSTNTTVLGYKDKTVKDFWPHFSNVFVNSSLDAVGPYIEIVRSGTVWEDVQENLSWMNDQPNVHVGYSPVISAINIWWIEYLFDYLKHVKLAQFTPVLAKPDGNEGLALIPQEFRPELIKKLQSCPFPNNNINQAIDVLKTQDTSDQRWWGFVSQQLMLDNIRKEKWFDSLPIKHKLYHKAYHYYG